MFPKNFATAIRNSPAQSCPRITAALVLGQLTRKLGVVPAANSFVEHIFERGGSALVYPGGDVEALRPVARPEQNRLLGLSRAS